MKALTVASASLAAIYIGMILIYEGQHFARVAMAMAKDAAR